MNEMRMIKIYRELAERLKNLRLTPRESYSEIIERLIDDHEKLQAMQLGE